MSLLRGASAVLTHCNAGSLATGGYGTALGVGDAVVRALRVLEIDLPEARYMRAMPVYFHPFVVASTRRVSSSGGRVSGSFGGGGFGAGGGFGGGGGGVR